MVARVAPTGATVLLSGERGAGKALLADLIQANSPRRDAPYVTVHCANVPAGLLEAELFGREPGAVPGADRRRIGTFEEAHRGTVLLQETGELPPACQIKLLRVLIEGRFARMGGDRPVEVDVRVVATSSGGLENLREDLVERLRVIEVRVPPLRERREEIPFLIEQFRFEINLRHRLRVARFAPDVLDALYAHPWPGNVRELRDVVERSMLLARSETLERSQLALETAPHVAVLPAPLAESLSTRQERILTRALSSGGVSNREVVELESVSSRTALRELRILVKRGLLVRVGHRRGAVYRPVAARK